MRIAFILILNLFLCHALLAGVQKTIAIFGYEDSRMEPWDPETIKTGIAGAEEALIYMSQELAQLGYKVSVFANPPKGSPHSLPEANPRFVRASDNDGTVFDVAVAWRLPWIAEALKGRAKKVYLWPHDTCQGIFSAEQINGFDDVLWLSKWQRENWISLNPNFVKFTKIFGNSVNLGQFKPITPRTNPYSCIYGSNYARGLEILLDIWPEIKRQYPRASLDIYYGWAHWGLLSPETESKLKRQISELALLDVQDHGFVGHEELNRAFEQASFWTYPCILPETFCITALRAQASGAVPVILEGSALSDTVRHGYKCKRVDEYLSTLLQAMKNAESITLEERKKMRHFIEEEFTWAIMAKKWQQVFEAVRNEATE